MCNKYDIKIRSKELVRALKGAYPHYDFELDDFFEDNYTEELMFPGGRVPALLPTKEEGKFRLVSTTWGFPTPINQGGKNVMIPVNNKRDDKLVGYFEKVLKTRRCILPMTSIIEWPKDVNGDKYEINIPYRITAETNDGLFFSAGLFDYDPKKREFFSTMITTSPNYRFAMYHNRMPAVLKTDEAVSYITEDPDIAKAMIGPSSSEDIAWKGEMLIEIMGKTEKGKIKKRSTYFQSEASVQLLDNHLYIANNPQVV